MPPPVRRMSPWAPHLLLLDGGVEVPFLAVAVDDAQRVAVVRPVLDVGHDERVAQLRRLRRCTHANRHPPAAGHPGEGQGRSVRSVKLAVPDRAWRQLNVRGCRWPAEHVHETEVLLPWAMGWGEKAQGTYEVGRRSAPHMHSPGGDVVGLTMWISCRVAALCQSFCLASLILFSTNLRAGPIPRAKATRRGTCMQCTSRPGAAAVAPNRDRSRQHNRFRLSTTTSSKASPVPDSLL